MTANVTPPGQTNQPQRRRPPILALLLGLAGLILAVAVVYLVFSYLLPAQPPQYPAQAPFANPPRATQQALLNELNWVSKPTGAARIPVDRAMQIIATQGLPTLVEVPGQTTPQAPATGGGGSGEQLFTSLGCIGCHTDQNGPIAPSLHGLYGSKVALTDGSTVTADDAYIKESILSPSAKVVKGFSPIMPSFQGKVTDAQIAQIIDYMKTLK